MAHQLQLENIKYRQWAKAGLGLRYLKDGLAPFCQHIADQQHNDILDNIRQTKSLAPNATCGTCQYMTLKPDHVKSGNRIPVCPLGQDKCNCWYPNGKNACPNGICGAIYDDIIQSHASRPPAPNWRNTSSQLWTSDPWSIAKCFINAPGYDQKTSAADTDCTGLLHIIINNSYFHSHIASTLTGANIFSKVRQYRNEIYHSSTMELEATKANSILDDMITVLKDSKELANRPDAQDAVQKLEELKNKDFIITSESDEELLKQVKEDLMQELNELKATVSTKEEVKELKRNLSRVEDLLKQTRDQLAKSTNATNKACKGLKRKLDRHTSELEEIKKRLPKQKSPDQLEQEYEKSKLEWRKKMIDKYQDTVLKVPAMLTLPDEECEFSKIYIRPKIITEVKDENREIKEIEIKSMTEIFTRSGAPLKSVYVVGDAGTGKSSFCKYLVNCWCMANSEGQIVEDDFNGVNEMKKFEFLFLVSLRHIQGIDNIHDMLKNQHKIDILDKLLEKDSAKILILLDGLDEWSAGGKTYSQFQTMGLPIHDIYKDYTIITTSRPWKIHTLKISNKEIQQLLKLKGFDYVGENEMIRRTVSHIKPTTGEQKDINDCQTKLREESLDSFRQVPIMLQQLTCLWFEGKLDKTSRCAVYSGMLELSFSWNEDKTAGTSSENIEESQTVELPVCLADKEICSANSYLIYDMSRLAYETLFKCPKAKSLTFDCSIFRKLKIADKVRKGYLKSGILTEDRCPSLSVSERPKSMFTFIHKSVQEFLAAVNIAINFKTNMNSLRKLAKEDFEKECIQIVNDVFQKCLTVNEILEQSNVIIMLCGLEPRLATHVSRYIYDIVNGDELVQRYRRTIDSDTHFISRHSVENRCIRDIQDLIFDSMEECNTSLVFYIGDLHIFRWGKPCDIICSGIDQQEIIPDSVHSIYVDDINARNVKFSKYLPKFKHLEKISINYDTLGSSRTKNVEHIIEEVSYSVAETIQVNASTLMSLSLSGGNFNNNNMYKKVTCILPSMDNLVAIEMKNIKMSHDNTTRLCEFLEGTSHLEQICIDIYRCECRKQHDVDLSKHQQLQYLYMDSSMSVTNIDTVNLEVLKCCNIKNTNYEKIFDSIMKCDKLKVLELYLDYNIMSQSFHINITQRLVSVLPLLHNLSKLKLWYFRLTDNIIQVLSEMKSLKSITLFDVTMSLTTWRKFVDSLPSIPHPVDVMLFCCYITEDGEEFKHDDIPLMGMGGEKNNDAIQYVKDQNRLFNVTCDHSLLLQFSTKK